MGVYSLAKSSIKNWAKYPNLMAGSTELSSDWLITQNVLASNTGSVTFDVSGLAAQGFKHLQIRCVVRTDTSANNDSLGLRFNGDSAANYAEHVLYGNGSSAASGAGTGQTFMSAANITGNTASANIFGGGVIDIIDFASSSKTKNIRSLSGNTAAPFVQLRSGLWTSTAPVTSITLYSANSAPNLLAGSRFSLYGIKG